MLHEEQVVEELRAMRARIADPDRWAPGDGQAVDAQGVVVGASSPDAVAWSVNGAALLLREHSAFMWMLKATEIAPPVKREHWSRFNATHDSALALCDRAIALAEHDAEEARALLELPF